MTTAAARLFLALWPDEPALDAAVAWQRSFDWPAQARPTAREALHVTLHFLGDVPRERLPALALALRVPVDPFTLVLDEARVWHGGIAVLEPSDVPAPLTLLHGRLAAALREAGQAVDARPYRPHLTLARHAPLARPPAQAPAAPAWRAWSYALVESRAGRYATLAAYGDRPA